MGELSGAISALALNANLNPRCSLSTVQDYFIEKLVSSRLMNVRHELPTTGIGTREMSSYADLPGLRTNARAEEADVSAYAAYQMR